MSEKNPHRTQIIVAVIGVIGILGGALFANWDKIFPKKDPIPTPTIVETKSNSKNRDFVNVYYFPSRESDALRTKIALEKKGFIVNLYKAGADLKLAENRPSYIKFKDIGLMSRVRPLIENLLRQEFNVSEAQKNWSKNTLLVILTNRSNDP